ncbi:MAG: hypothetical protein EP343_26405 [Deltaproteobacteria bacterium]|nr:MAG: hypothetical protein EP343_26405 [Deltaproteobacteria bacterium]
MKKKPSHNRAFAKWLMFWLALCGCYMTIAGGVNCKCPPPEPDGEIVDVDASETKDDCYCVAPGSPCQIDGDCRTKIKYCIFLTCQSGSCQEPRETPPPEPVPEETNTEPPPTCPVNCGNDTDCNKDICGEYIYCKEGRCSKSDIVIPP